MSRISLGALVTAAALLLAGCGGDAGEARGEHGDRPGGGGSRAGGPGGGSWGGGLSAVPVEVATVERRDISSFIETNGTLEAENEVDVVARTSGRIVELRAEEGMRASRGQVLARLEQDEIQAQLEIARVRLEETRLSYERAQRLRQDDLISVEMYEQARSAHESARAQFEGSKILLDYTEIRAPFDGLIVQRYVDFAENVQNGTPLFRISDFTPLLCPIQVPERELGKLRQGQRAWLRVESHPGERFGARVLRISPVVDAATGTVKVTLDVDGRGRLRPGMFARVFLETATRDNALVIPKSALSLESIGDTVYVAAGGTAARREVRLGFREANHVEVLSGLEAGELVVVVGQDGLSEGTPVQVVRRDGAPADSAAGPMRAATAGAESPAAGSGPEPPRSGEAPPAAGSGRPGGRPGGRPDLSKMTPEQLERAKEFMRRRGLTEEQIEERIRRAREGAAGDDGPGDRGTPR